MNLDLMIVPIDKYKVLLLDNSLPNEINELFNIYSMNIDIVSSKIKNGSILNIDIIPYIYLYKKDRELYTITSDILGLGYNVPIPDGVYTIKWTVNTVYTITQTFVFYLNIKEKVDKLILDTGYKVEVGNFDISFVGDEIEAQGDIEKCRLAVYLLDRIKTMSAEGNEIEINKTIDKLQRLLLIIK